MNVGKITMAGKSPPASADNLRAPKKKWSMRLLNRYTGSRFIGNQALIGSICDGVLRVAPIRWWLPFVGFTIVPALVVGGYLTFFASHQYVAEARFVVRGFTEPLMSTGGSGPGSNITGTLITLNNNQEATVVVSFVRSGAFIEKLKKEIDFNQIFGQADRWFRLEPDQPTENIVRYWNRMVAVELDPVSGVISIKVTAFTPDDALSLSKRILEHSENLVNDLERRQREDTLKRAEQEVFSTLKKVDIARGTLQRLRDKVRFIDAERAADSLFRTLVQLRYDRSVAETNLSIVERRLDHSAPTIQELTARLRKIDDQINLVEAQLTGSGSGSADPSASEAIESFESLKTQVQFAEDNVIVAERVLGAARSDSMIHHVYFEIYMSPTLPERSSGPHSLALSLAFLVGAAALWFIFVFFIRSIMQHAD